MNLSTECRDRSSRIGQLRREGNLMIGLPASITQPLGDIGVPFQGGRRRAEEFQKFAFWCREWHNPERKCMIRYGIDLTRDCGGAVGKHPPQHTG